MRNSGHSQISLVVTDGKIGTKPTATVIMTLLWLWFCIEHITQYVYHTVITTQITSGTGQEIGSPLIPFHWCVCLLTAVTPYASMTVEQCGRNPVNLEWGFDLVFSSLMELHSTSVLLVSVEPEWHFTLVESPIQKWKYLPHISYFTICIFVSFYIFAPTLSPCLQWSISFMQ